VAIIQKDLKRMLAYSSIAHAGYVLIGILSMSQKGYASAMFYALAYLIMNFSCFMVLTKVADGGRNLRIRELAGLHKRSPLLALTLMLGLFGLAGIPPTVGFTGKFLLFTAAMEKGFFALVVIGMINATISLYYYLIVVKAAYLLEPEVERPKLEICCGTRVLSYALIVTMVVVGMFPNKAFDLVLAAAKLLIT
jgi:NADH-quinone oxidoreductase subunit N